MIQTMDTPVRKHAAIDYPGEGPAVNLLWADRFLLALQDISVVFDGFKALNLHAFGIEHNELRVIIGPNGAGKTTFCDIVSGKTRPTTGAVFFNGEDITSLNETEIALKGVGRKFQTPTVYDSLTTFENMELALPGNQRPWGNLIRRHTAEEKDRIFAILERVRLADAAKTAARYLSHGQRQWLAISTLILAKPKLLLVDEPAAGLTDAETELTAELLLELRGDHTLVVIEHDMDFVRRLDARVTVFNEGRILAEGSMDDVRQDEQVKQAYLGR